MNDDFFIIGIGASKGEESTLYDFFANIPHDLNAAYILFLQQKRDHQSQTKFLLSRHTRYPIYTIRNGEKIKSSCIYLVPENTVATVDGGHLMLFRRGVDTDLELTLDEFYRGLAREVKKRAVGILLSGTPDRTSNGTKAIEEMGGLVMINEELAIETSLTKRPDWVLPARQMGLELRDYINSRCEKGQLL
jgi:two-component system CheB/CheR fusion protein